MKKFICFLLALITIFSFTGCCDDNEKNEQQTESITEKYVETLENEDDDTNTYILNKSSYKFHYPDCSYVDLMLQSNKKIYKGNRKEVISMGYVACQRCCP